MRFLALSAFYSLAFDFCTCTPTVTHDSLWHTFRVYSDTPDLNRVNTSPPRHFSVFPPTGAEGPWLHLRVGLRQRRPQQGPLLLRRLHQLHLHHLHLQHGREWTQAVVPGGVLVHTDHYLQQRGELRPQDCEYGRGSHNVRCIYKRKRGVLTLFWVWNKIESLAAFVLNTVFSFKKVTIRDGCAIWQYEIMNDKYMSMICLSIISIYIFLSSLQVCLPATPWASSGPRALNSFV